MHNYIYLENMSSIYTIICRELQYGIKNIRCYDEIIKNIRYYGITNHSNCELWHFIKNIELHEIGLVDIIKFHMKSYTFKTKQELKKAVHLWCVKKTKALKIYGHIKDWDVSQITDMSDLFAHKSDFNDDISRWDVSNVVTMMGMFRGAGKFNQPIGEWDVSKVTDMSYMFSGAKEFNQPIGDWDVSNVVTMRGMSSMFSHASAFNQNIGSWKIHRNIEMKGMFCKADSLNYSNLYR